MRTRIAALFLAVLMGGFSLSAAVAAPGPFFAFPRNDYPKKSVISYANHLTGLQADCAINFDCTGTTGGGSLNHSHEQDYWHRVDGEVQAAESRTKHGVIDWGATLQSYETADYALAVFQDLIATTTITNEQTYRFHEVTAPVAGTADLSVIKLQLRGKHNSITILAAQLGPSEAEIGAAYSNHDKALAMKYLGRQLNEALTQMAEQVAP